MNSVIDFINANRDRYVDELKAYLAIPSISALPEHAADVKACAERTARELERVGLENVRVIETPGNPVVYADWIHADGAPTILFYGHYDVQPVDPVEEWESPPFEATVREGEIYARGAADDKGQIFMHFKAVEACMKQTGRLPVNIRSFWRARRKSAALISTVSSETTSRGWPPMWSSSPIHRCSTGSAITLLRTPRLDLLPARSARHEDRSTLRFVRWEPWQIPPSSSRRCCIR